MQLLADITVTSEVSINLLDVKVIILNYPLKRL